MPDHLAHLPSERMEPANRETVPSLRERLLPGVAFEDEVAKALNCSRRTVQRLGLPFVRIGKRRGYLVSGAHDEIRRRIAQEGGR
jgi:hypothetical protein